ncbi:MAG: hypothetical protein U0350_49305 [Caldilineaceae bacterium]
MTRFYLPLENKDWLGLSELARRECRSPKEQLVYLLRREIGRHSPPNAPATTNDKSAQLLTETGAFAQ